VLRKAALTAVIALAVQACAGLNLSALVQPPRFAQAPGQRAEVRVQGPSGSQLLGGAAVRLWTKVTNPNTFGLTLQTIKGTLYLEDSRATDVDFPLGLPLGAGAETVIPIDLSISFSDLPGLAGVARRLMNREAVPYRLDGTIGLDVPRVGRGMMFGPMTLLRGEAAVPSADRPDRAEHAPGFLARRAVRMQPLVMGPGTQP
jgi:hypothetical protein